MNRLRDKLVLYLILVSVFLSANSCTGPTSKEVYLKQFENFVANVGRDYRDYSKSDWKYADERFRKFSKDWHDDFKEDLTLKEDLKVGSLIVKYESYKGNSKLKEIYDEIIKEDVEKIKKKIEYYIDNDLDNDVENLKKGAKEIGDSALKVVEDLIDEIDN
jgi:putative sterol carrier protein